MGDPTGVGPEVLAKALADLTRHSGSSPTAHLLLVGDSAVWRDAQRSAEVRISTVAADRPGPIADSAVPFLDVPPADRSWRMGEMSPIAGQASATWLERAARMALDGLADAVVFAPLNKQAMIRAGYSIRDEYDLCARLAQIDDHDEMNVIPHPAAQHSGSELLWVARATAHVALRDVPSLLTTERILRTIRLAHRVAKSAAGTDPRIGVAGLNPHSGEGGLLGDEELRVIRPAIEKARREGLDASGPHPPDHIFRLARMGAFDVVVTMYHDQAQIATKLLGFERGVSVGVGYPFVLTTPSHGTAFDIAGKGIADHRPMLEALRLAQRLTNRS
ncbi:MAG TPA: 4-hydroxythreonine-4-phosphate dehydrogenase PdxA [bacterium]|nr:4-hydroxythreonine-4-phosphate dehydrogenase PdxA [bacterium]